MRAASLDLAQEVLGHVPDSLRNLYLLYFFLFFFSVFVFRFKFFVLSFSFFVFDFCFSILLYGIPGIFFSHCFVFVFGFIYFLFVYLSPTTTNFLPLGSVLLSLSSSFLHGHHCTSAKELVDDFSGVRCDNGIHVQVAWTLIYTVLRYVLNEVWTYIKSFLCVERYQVLKQQVARTLMLFFFLKVARHATGVIIRLCSSALTLSLQCESGRFPSSPEPPDHPQPLTPFPDPPHSSHHKL